MKHGARKKVTRSLSDLFIKQWKWTRLEILVACTWYRRFPPEMQSGLRPKWFGSVAKCWPKWCTFPFWPRILRDSCVSLKLNGWKFRRVQMVADQDITHGESGKVFVLEKFAVLVEESFRPELLAVGPSAFLSAHGGEVHQQPRVARYLIILSAHKRNQAVPPETLDSRVRDQRLTPTTQSLVVSRHMPGATPR